MSRILQTLPCHWFYGNWAHGGSEVDQDDVMAREAIADGSKTESIKWPHPEEHHLAQLRTYTLPSFSRIALGHSGFYSITPAGTEATAYAAARFKERPNRLEPKASAASEPCLRQEPTTASPRQSSPSSAITSSTTPPRKTPHRRQIRTPCPPQRSTATKIRQTGTRRIDECRRIGRSITSSTSRSAKYTRIRPSASSSRSCSRVCGSMW